MRKHNREHIDLLPGYLFISHKMALRITRQASHKLPRLCIPASLWSAISLKTNSTSARRTAVRSYATSAQAATAEKLSTSKAEGDISSVFSSLSGAERPPLPQRFADLKKHLIAGHEEQVKAAWNELLLRLRREIDCIHSMGPRVVPTIDFKDVKKGSVGEDFNKAMKRHGVAVVKGVVPEEQALQWKEDAREYIKKNPHTKGKATAP